MVDEKVPWYSCFTDGETGAKATQLVRPSSPILSYPPPPTQQLFVLILTFILYQLPLYVINNSL